MVLQVEKKCAAYGLRHLSKKKSQILDSKLMGCDDDNSYYLLFEKEFNKAILESVAHCCICINHNISARNFESILRELYPLLPCTALAWANRAYLFGAIGELQRHKLTADNNILNDVACASEPVGESKNDKCSTITEILEAREIDYGDNRRVASNLRQENILLQLQIEKFKQEQKLEAQINKYEEYLQARITKLEAKAEIYEDKLFASQLEIATLRGKLRCANEQIESYETEKERKHEKFNKKLSELEKQLNETTEKREQQLNERFENEQREIENEKKKIEDEKRKTQEEKKKMLDEREKIENETKQIENETKRMQEQKNDVTRQADRVGRIFDFLIDEQIKKHQKKIEQIPFLLAVLIVLLGCLLVQIPKLNPLIV